MYCHAVFSECLFNKPYPTAQLKHLTLMMIFDLHIKNLIIGHDFWISKAVKSKFMWKSLLIEQNDWGEQCGFLCSLLICPPVCMHQIEWLILYMIWYILLYIADFYNITNAKGKVAKFTLFKQAYKLGEDIVGMFDFSEGTVPCVQVTIFSFVFSSFRRHHTLHTLSQVINCIF